jgi:metallo-beta-lactamase class B
VRTRLVGVSLAIAVLSGFGLAVAIAQSNGSRVDAHVAAAKAAAGTDFAGVFNRICAEAVPPATPATPRPAAPRPAGPPPRSEWHAEPAKVFDNLYFLGQTEYSVWAVTTSAGIILIDAIFDGSKTKLPALERRKPGDPHPYVIGTDGVQRYLTVVDECAQAGLARVQ